MKKLLYFVVSVLSLGVIFAAGWASGVGTVANDAEQPAVVRSGEITDDCPDCPENDDRPDVKDGAKERDIKFYKHGFRIKIPFPPVDRDNLLPKTVC